MRHIKSTVLSWSVAGLMLSAASLAGIVGPSPYTSSNDSPFKSVDFSGGYFHLEDFEDLLLNTPGVSSSPIGSPTGPGGLTDSIDADDGAIDGNGTNGHSLFGNGATGFSFIFDDSVLGALPTHAGIVWTDGEGTISFEAFAQDGSSLGTIGPFSDSGVVPDGNFVGGTAEDRFFGADNAAGISRIFISNSAGGIEVDHLQYGNGLVAPPPPPNAIPLPPAVYGSFLLFGAAVAAYRRRSRVAL